MSKNIKVEELKTKRFVIRKSLIGKNVVFSFTNKKGDNIKYNHDKVYSIMKSKLETLPCWEKYKSYTATNNIPLVCRNVEILQQNNTSKSRSWTHLTTINNVNGQ